MCAGHEWQGAPNTSTGGDQTYNTQDQNQKEGLICMLLRSGNRRVADAALLNYPCSCADCTEAHLLSKHSTLRAFVLAFGCFVTVSFLRSS